jgi:2-methylcitrate dehydratase PrpD
MANAGPEAATVDATALFVKNFTSTRYEDLPPEVVDVTKKQVLDFLGVALGGSSEAGVGEMTDLVLEWGGAPQSSIYSWGQKVPAPHAAQVNATMGHSLDYDDVHEAAVMHPGVVTIPTALAMSEYVGGVSGREFITAVALGTDFICRLGLATRPGENVHAFGWHLTSLYGYMTAAAVAARLLGLDEVGTTNAIGIGYHQSAGNGQCVKDGALTKRMGPGMAVRGGIAAALMAKRGITGARNCLEGVSGMYQVYHRGAYSREALVGELGTRFEGVNVSIKPYPCCRGVHPFIDAALLLVDEHDIRPEQVESILISCGEGTFGLLGTPLEVKTRPRNFVDSQFSLPWGVATVVARRRATIADFTEAAIVSEDILDVSRKIDVQIDPSLSRDDEMEPARVRMTMTDGAVYTQQVDLPTGTPSRPLSFADIERKFEDCVAHAARTIPTANARGLVESAGRLEELEDVTALVRLVTWD